MINIDKKQFGQSYKACNLYNIHCDIE